MNAILSGSPYFLQPSPQAAFSAASEVAVRVTPVTTSSAGRGAGGSTDFSGNGSGSRTPRRETLPVMMLPRGQPSSIAVSDATPNSVVAAQSSTEAVMLDPVPQLPEVLPPDPLPTAPILQRD